MNLAKCEMPRCDQPAEVEWRVNGDEPVRRSHRLCGACMAMTWTQISDRYPTTAAHHASSFTAIGSAA